MGVPFGPPSEMHRGTIYNPGGYFERKDINDANDAYIASAGTTLADPGDPQELVRCGDKDILRAINTEWMRGARHWAIKDPRLCFTLLSWLEHGIIDRASLSLVHVRRQLEAATRSGLKDPNIPTYCDGTEVGIRTMLDRYAERAAWHVDCLSLPTFSLTYEQLIADPDQTVYALAGFLGITDKRAIRRAINVVGKKKGLFLYQLHRYLVRAPRKAWRLLRKRCQGIF